MGVRPRAAMIGVMPATGVSHVSRLPGVAPRSSGSEPPLRRYIDRGVLGGVCAGLAEHLGVDVRLVRLLATVLVLLGGLGIAVYAIAVAVIPVDPDSAAAGRRPGARRDAVLIVIALAIASIAGRASGLRVADSIVWPLVLGACGLALVWRPLVGPVEQPGFGRRLSPRRLLRRARQVDGPRLAIGALLVSFAAAGVLHAAGVLENLGKAIGAVAIVATIVSLLFVPWLVRLARSLSTERSARIREQERAELAAHLHDSVLQTLALIQQRSDDPREVAGLARRQERELRHWLLGRPGRSGEETVAGALERAAAEVEELHRVPIEVVTVGDGPLEPELEAVVQAAREAMTNAAKFADAARVDLYAEVEPDRVEVFVRDRGVGFDPRAIPADRRGVRDSIIARMERHHGRAEVHSSPGAGTEVALVMGRGGPS